MNGKSVHNNLTQLLSGLNKIVLTKPKAFDNTSLTFNTQGNGHVLDDYT